MDFSRLRARVDAAWRSLDHTTELTPEATARILEERAQQYAARFAAQDAFQVVERAAVVFRVGDERLAIPAQDVEAVTPCARLDPLPLAPRFVRGVVAFRGQAVLVLSLHELAGRSAPPPGEGAQLIITRWRKGLAGLLADSVDAIRPLTDAELLPPGDHSWLDTVALAHQLPDGVVLLHLEGLARQLESSTSDANKWGSA